MASGTAVETARREIAALAGSGLGAADIQRAALDVMRRAVPYDATCWATVDPVSLLPTGSITVDLNPSAREESLFAEIEYGTPDVNAFAELARQPVPVKRLSDLPYGVVVRSRRVNELWRPMGVAHELRAAFVVDGACWGVAGLLRGADSPDFDSADIDFLASVAPMVAVALRTASRTRDDATAADSGPPGPVVFFCEGSQYRPATSAARRWLDAVDAARPGAVAIALRALTVAALQSPDRTAQARLREPSGAWMVLRCAPLLEDEQRRQTVLTVEPAPRHDVATVLVSAYALSPRESEVCQHVLDGKSTADIARQMFLSPYTVQDHLKSIFTKVGVRSRAELASLLQAGT